MRLVRWLFTRIASCTIKKGSVNPLCLQPRRFERPNPTQPTSSAQPSLAWICLDGLEYWIMLVSFYRCSKATSALEFRDYLLLDYESPSESPIKPHGLNESPVLQRENSPLKFSYSSLRRLSQQTISKTAATAVLGSAAMYRLNVLLHAVPRLESCLSASLDHGWCAATKSD